MPRRTNYDSVKESTQQISTDWQLNESVLDRNAYMLKHGIQSDVTFNVHNHNCK